MKLCSFCHMEVKSLENKVPPACKKCYSRYLYEDKRNKKRYVECEFKISSKCNKVNEISLRAESKIRKRNEGKYICLQCSRKLKFSERKNLNCKYDIPVFFFSDIDREIKAYILGWIASNGMISKNGFNISINRRDIKILDAIKNGICKEVPIKQRGNLVCITFNSKQMSRDLCKHLSVSPEKKLEVVRFPLLLNDCLKWAFVRGFFDGSGSVSSVYYKNSPRCNIISLSRNMLNDIHEFVKIPGYLEKNQVKWSGNNALDFMGKIYNEANIKLERKYDRYVDWSLWQPNLSGGCHGKSNKFRWVKTDKEAVPPQKTKVSDSGYDITIIKKTKTVGDVEFYDTGIKIQPDFGYYFDLVPRSSISKTGYMLANCVGIIDRTYIGPIIVALRKIDKNAKDINLPCRIAQIIPRHIINLQAMEVEELDETARGDGGFGSTGDK